MSINYGIKTIIINTIQTLTPPIKINLWDFKPIIEFVLVQNTPKKDREDFPSNCSRFCFSCCVGLFVRFRCGPPLWVFKVATLSFFFFHHSFFFFCSFVLFEKWSTWNILGLWLGGNFPKVVDNHTVSNVSLSFFSQGFCISLWTRE